MSRGEGENTCVYPGCNREGQFATYQLLGDFTKVWMSPLCARHEKLIHQENSLLKKQHPDGVWTDIKEYKRR